MRYVMQLLIIICFSFAGEVLHRVLPLPFPASIYGIILLYLALETKIVKVKQIKEVSTTLILAMPVMFVPAAVGLTDTWEEISPFWAEYLLIAIASTFVVMAVAGLVTQWMITGRKAKHKKQKSNDGNRNI